MSREPMETDPKIAKKAAKAAVKAAKKQAIIPAPPGAGDEQKNSPAARSAAAAERQVGLTRWRVVLGILSILVALITLYFTIWK